MRDRFQEAIELRSTGQAEEGRTILLDREEPAASYRGFSPCREAGLSGLEPLLIEKMFQMC